MQKKQVKLKVVDKNIDKGWFYKTYIVTFQSDTMNQGNPFAVEVCSEDYYSFLLNTSGLIFFESEDGVQWRICRGPRN